jgi:hypothetical protein
VSDLKQIPFYRDDNFAVAMWEGDAGDALGINVSEPTRRADFACFTVVMRGALEMFSPSGKKAWAYRAGDTSDDGGDFDEVGVWEWRATATPTQEMCVSVLDEGGMETNDQFPHQIIRLVKGERADIKAKGLLILPVGSVNTGSRTIAAPHFARIDNALSVTALEDGTKLMVVRRR